MPEQVLLRLTATGKGCRKISDGLGKQKEDTGLRSGGRGKSEIPSALRMCSTKYYIKKPYAKLYFSCQLLVGKLLKLSHRI